MSRTLEQHRAKYALDQVSVVGVPHKEDNKAKYGTLVRRLSAMIMNNGLGQALAFLLADDEGEHKKPSWLLYQQLQDWLSGPATSERPSRIYIGTEPNLIQHLMLGNREGYQRAQQESLALLAWMTKFADAYLPKGSE